MIETEKTITYELLPEEIDGPAFGNMISKTILGTCWVVDKVTPRKRFVFDANYNRYYAKVTYTRERFRSND